MELQRVDVISMIRNGSWVSFTGCEEIQHGTKTFHLEAPIRVELYTIYHFIKQNKILTELFLNGQIENFKPNLKVYPEGQKIKMSIKIYLKKKDVTFEHDFLGKKLS